jgi:hypothetical protein
MACRDRGRRTSAIGRSTLRRRRLAGRSGTADPPAQILGPVGRAARARGSAGRRTWRRRLESSRKRRSSARTTHPHIRSESIKPSRGWDRSSLRSSRRAGAGSDRRAISNRSSRRVSRSEGLGGKRSGVRISPARLVVGRPPAPAERNDRLEFDRPVVGAELTQPVDAVRAVLDRRHLRCRVGHWLILSEIGQGGPVGSRRGHRLVEFIRSTRHITVPDRSSA